MASVDGPEDPELRNVIDKLAAFVARNGPEFEAMTRDKQKDNPHFAFLFPGNENYVFYKKRCIEEQVKVKSQSRMAQPEKPNTQQTQPQQANSSRPSRFSGVPAASGQSSNSSELLVQINELKDRISAMRSQLDVERAQADSAIRESETNLRAQHAALSTKQQVRIEEALRAVRGARLSELAATNALRTDELDAHVDSVAMHCTKDNIQAAKAFIIALLAKAAVGKHSETEVSELMASYLQQRVLQRDAPFIERLHLLYLVNDLLHHTSRKQQEDFRCYLEKVIVSMMYTMKQQSPDEEHRQKLEKLIIIWTQSRYFANETLEALQDGDGKLLQNAYQNYLLTHYRTTIDQVNEAVQREYAGFQSQHAEFVSTTESQLAAHERAIDDLQKQQGALEHRLAMQTQAETVASSFGPAAMAPRFGPPVSGPQSGGLNFGPGLIGPPPSGMPPMPVGFNPAIPPPPFGGPPPTDFPFRGPPPNSAGPGGMPPFAPRFPGPLPMPGSGPLDFSRPPPPFTTQPPPFVSLGAAVTPAGLLGNGPPPGMPMSLGGPVPLMSIQFGGRFPDSFRSRSSDDDSRSRSRSHSRSSRSRSRSRSRSGSRSRSSRSRSSSSRYSASPRRDHPAMHVGWPDQPQPDALEPGVGADGELDTSAEPVYCEADLIPNVPYYLLPAGLMVPLVDLADSEYAPLDPAAIRLPPPRRPDARLLAALEAFYAPASRENPRDADGWEKLGLFEFFKAKERAKRLLETTNKRERERDRDGSERDTKRKRTESSSTATRKRDHSRERSREHDRSRERGHRNSRSRSKSPANRSRARESESQRSPSPSSFTPSFSFANSMNAALKTPLDAASNKGAQLMAKMGWTGAGLGATDQGRVEPVPIDEVRSGADAHKGVGIRVNDPFEQFRRSMSEQIRSRWTAATK